MGMVSAIRAGKGRGKRVSVFLDGSFAFSLETGIALKENLQVGLELSEDQIKELSRLDGYHRCLHMATYYLSYRPRSEAELRERLYRHGFDNDSVEAVIKLLREQALVDDVAFAQFWRDNRESFNPRSQWLTKLELRRKGVAPGIIDQVVDEINDEDSAYRAAMGKLRSLPRTDYQSFCRRLGAYLKRRGFSYGVISNTARRIWQEQRSNTE